MANIHVHLGRKRRDVAVARKSRDGYEKVVLDILDDVGITSAYFSGGALHVPRGQGQRARQALERAAVSREHRIVNAPEEIIEDSVRRDVSPAGAGMRAAKEDDRKREELRQKLEKLQMYDANKQAMNKAEVIARAEAKKPGMTLRKLEDLIYQEFGDDPDVVEAAAQAFLTAGGKRRDAGQWTVEYKDSKGAKVVKKFRTRIDAVDFYEEAKWDKSLSGFMIIDPQDRLIYSFRDAINRLSFPQASAAVANHLAEKEGKIIAERGKWWYRKPNDRVLFGPYNSAGEAADAARRAGVLDSTRDAGTDKLAVVFEDRMGWYWSATKGGDNITIGPFHSRESALADMRRVGYALDPLRRRDAESYRIVYNRLLGAWYAVRGPHQSPIGGPGRTKEEVQEQMRRKEEARNARSPQYQRTSSYTFTERDDAVVRRSRDSGLHITLSRGRKLRDCGGGCGCQKCRNARDAEVGNTRKDARKRLLQEQLREAKERGDQEAAQRALTSLKREFPGEHHGTADVGLREVFLAEYQRKIKDGEWEATSNISRDGLVEVRVIRSDVRMMVRVRGLGTGISDTRVPKTLEELRRQGFSRTGSAARGWTEYWTNEDGGEYQVEYGPRPEQVRSITTTRGARDRARA